MPVTARDTVDGVRHALPVLSTLAESLKIASLSFKKDSTGLRRCVSLHFSA